MYQNLEESLQTIDYVITVGVRMEKKDVRQEEERVLGVSGHRL